MVAESFSWMCPSCGRRVPSRVDVCHCGTKRSVAQLRDEVPVTQRVVQPRRSLSPASWIALGAALGASFTWSLLRIFPKQQEAPPARAVVVEAPPPASPTPTPRTEAEDEILAEWQALEILPDPTPAPEPEEPEELAVTTEATRPAGPTAMEREQDRARAFESRLQTLSRQADALDADFDRYLNTCYPRLSSEPAPGIGNDGDRAWLTLLINRSSFEWRESSTRNAAGMTVAPRGTVACRNLWRQIDPAATAIRQAMEALSEDARRARILPGVLRQLRRQYRMRWSGWD